MRNNGRRKTAVYVFMFYAVLCVLFVLVYKAQLRQKFEEPVTCTLKTLHKANGTVGLSADYPELKQTFICTVPSLKRIRIECRAEKIDSKARLLVLLLDTQTGEEYFRKESKVKNVASKGSAKLIDLNLEVPLESSEGTSLTLLLKLLDGKDTLLSITGNTKQGIVQSFNDIETDKTNIIYDITYSEAGTLVWLYILLCGALLFFAGVCFYLFEIRKRTLSQAYVPLAIILGIIFNFLIMVNGVPDEPAHIDTAYKYSNVILGKNTGNVNTIYKRQCDIEMTDMLVNGLESNSYYQLLRHFFEFPENTELIEVSALDAGSLVPGIVYVPSAIGISIGRLLGLSTLFALSLGRIMNLLFFVFLTWWAILLIPYGKNMFAMVMLLPISLQQAASFSYDSVINGIIALFIAMCFQMSDSKINNERVPRGKLLFPGVLTLFLAVSKGGVYLPLCLLWLPVFQNNRKHGQRKSRVNIKIAVVGLFALLVLIGVLVMKFLPMFTQFFLENQGETTTGVTTFYNAGYLLRNPQKILYLYWNTFMKRSDLFLQGLLGGCLSWQDISIRWVYLFVLFIGMLLLVNVKEDKYAGSCRQRLLLGTICLGSSALVLMSMLLSYTAVTLDYIEGVQGRYFLPLFPVGLLLASTNMVSVDKKQCCKISTVMMVTEIMIVLNVATGI